MKRYRHTFTVIAAKGFPFPIDMLRYDACFPDTEDGSYEIERSLRAYGAKHGSAIVLATIRTKTFTPTVARWQSFGWDVSIGSQRMEPLHD